MMEKEERVAFAFLVFCFLVYLGFALPLIPVASDDIRMAGVFSMDESLAAEVIRHLHRAVSLDPPVFKYGGGFSTIPPWPFQKPGGLQGR